VQNTYDHIDLWTGFADDISIEKLSVLALEHSVDVSNGSCQRTSLENPVNAMRLDFASPMLKNYARLCCFWRKVFDNVGFVDLCDLDLCDFLCDFFAVCASSFCTSYFVMFTFTTLFHF
jgi:hypothetical protein